MVSDFVATQGVIRVALILLCLSSALLGCCLSTYQLFRGDVGLIMLTLPFMISTAILAMSYISISLMVGLTGISTEPPERYFIRLLSIFIEQSIPQFLTGLAMILIQLWMCGLGAYVAYARRDHSIGALAVPKPSSWQL